MKKMVIIGVVMLFALVVSVQAYYDYGIVVSTSETEQAEPTVESIACYPSHVGLRWCGHLAWWNHHTSDQRQYRTYKWWTS